jgi:hypothetical protein
MPILSPGGRVPARLSGTECQPRRSGMEQPAIVISVTKLPFSLSCCTMYVSRHSGTEYQPRRSGTEYQASHNI